MNWVLAATLCICGASVFTSCTSSNDNPVDAETGASGIVMIGKLGQVEYWQQVESAFRTACEEADVETTHWQAAERHHLCTRLRTQRRECRCRGGCLCPAARHTRGHPRHARQGRQSIGRMSLFRHRQCRLGARAGRRGEGRPRGRLCHAERRGYGASRSLQGRQDRGHGLSRQRECQQRRGSRHQRLRRLRILQWQRPHSTN